MMNDDHAKQSTDADQGQNVASEGDLHRAILNSSNPAFHTLALKGLKGEIEPVVLAKTEAVKKQKDIKQKDKKKKVSEKKTSGQTPEKTLKKASENTFKKKSERTREKASKKKLQTAKKRSKAKSSEETVAPAVTKMGRDSAVSTENLSEFSQWLSGLVSVAPPAMSSTKTEDANEDLLLKSGDPDQMARVRETDPVAEQTVKSKSKDRIESASAEEKVKKVKGKNSAQEKIKKVKRKNSAQEKIKKVKRKNSAQEKTRKVKGKHSSVKKATHKKKKKKKRISESGVILPDDIFSETLADLLASQGHANQAIHMYEKMRLIYPEKSRFFASKIEKLHKKE